MSHTESESPVSLPPRIASDSPSATPTDPEQRLWQAFTEAGTAAAFFQSWLALQCAQIPGVLGGVVVMVTGAGESYVPTAFWPIRGNVSKSLAGVAERALVEARGLVVPTAQSGSAPGSYGVAYPIQLEGRSLGCVALELGGRPEGELQAALHQLQWGAAWVQTQVLREQTGVALAARDRLQAALDLAAAAFSEERFFGAASAFVTALATRLACDRVSLGFLRGGQSRVCAVSHSAQVGKQTNLIRAMAAAMDEAVDQRATIVFPSPADGPSLVTRAHAELGRQDGSGAVCSLPLMEGDRVLGALTLEREADHPFDAATVELLEAVATLVGSFLGLRRRDDRWLIIKVGAALRDSLEWVAGPRHLEWKAAAAAVVVLLGYLVLATGEFRVAAITVLEPIVRQAVAAPFNGYVAQAPARAGDLVRQGQVLAQLDDRELRLERLKWVSQYDQLARQHAQARAIRNAAQVVILAAQMDQARAETALLDDQLARTRLAAPFEGIVVTGDLSQALASPVERGQVLFEVAPLDAYRVVLQVDERDIAQVAPGQRGHLLLTGNPAQAHAFVIGQVTPVSTPREGRNHFRVEAALLEKPTGLRPGMEGVGKVTVGDRPLLWIWSRQFVDWVRLQLWTWLP
jgi:multidrug efflux pump subunit AcrA (membrane-fusion protein)